MLITFSMSRLILCCCDAYRVISRQSLEEHWLKMSIEHKNDTNLITLIVHVYFVMTLRPGCWSGFLFDHKTSWCWAWRSCKRKTLEFTSLLNYCNTRHCSCVRVLVSRWWHLHGPAPAGPKYAIPTQTKFRWRDAAESDITEILN